MRTDERNQKTGDAYYDYVCPDCDSIRVQHPPRERLIRRSAELNSFLIVCCGPAIS
jgi:hypothetical protein